MGLHLHISDLAKAVSLKRFMEMGVVVSVK